MKKKILQATALLSIIAVLCSCGADDDSEEEYIFEENAAEETYDEGEAYDQENYDQEYSEQEGEAAGEGAIDVGEATNAAVQMMVDAYEEFRTEAMADPVRNKEVTPEKESIDTGEGSPEEADVCTIELNGHKMKYTMRTIGEPDINGKYPLYITLHGGGGGAPEDNNEQWVSMMSYYSYAVTSGIYVAVRGMEDVWNMHFLDEAFPMYDRLIEDMILLKNADPNRVYLLGFSAGGDGVYGIAPKMADRFAAVNMSSGHPNGISLLNTSNLPFEIQVGICDFYTEDAIRSIRGAEFEKTLTEFNGMFGFGYPHRVLVHVPEGHNYNDVMYDDEYPSYVLKDPAQFASRAVDEGWPKKFLDLYVSLGNDDSIMTMSYNVTDPFYDKLMDYVKNDLGMEVEAEDTTAVTYVDGFVRNASPDKFVWDLYTRAPQRKDTAFYWLKADYSVNAGLIAAAYDKETNSIVIQAMDEPNGDITILASPFLVDFDRPLTIITPNDQIEKELHADMDIIKNSLSETGDINLAWADEITVSLK